MTHSEAGRFPPTRASVKPEALVLSDYTGENAGPEVSEQILF